MTTKTTTKSSPGRPRKASNPNAMSVSTPKIKTKIKQKGSEEYELVKPNGAIFMMRNSSYNMYDEKTRQMRNVRYSPNEPSIFTDEQTLNPVRQPVIFHGGKLFVEDSKPNLIEFLDSHPSNEANGGSVFRKVDTVKNAKVDIDAEFLVVDALSLVRTKPLDDLLAIAIAKGFDADRPVEEIKHDLIVYAKRNPKVFIGAFDNPEVKVKATIKQARDYQIIKINHKMVSWFDSNKMIVSVPDGRDPIDVFARYLLTENGSATLSEIESQMSK
jgi:hypothetical protein